MSIKIDKGKLCTALGISTLPKVLTRYSGDAGFVFAEALDGVLHVAVLVHTTATALTVVEAFFTKRYSPPTTMQCTAKSSAKIANLYQYLFGLEDAPGFRNGTAFRNNTADNTITLMNAANGTTTSTSTTAYDPTVKHTYKIEWTSTQINYYIDGTLVATATTNIPTVPMQPFVEQANNTGAALNAVYPLYSFGGLIE
jgi:hypothetical protein